MKILRKLRKGVDFLKKIRKPDAPSFNAKITVLRQGGAYFHDIGALAISDLQLGYEEVLEREGISVPVRQYSFIKEAISEMLDETKAKKLIINGDLKHEFSRAMQQEWNEVIDLVEFAEKRGVELILVRGNHDNYAQNILRAQKVRMRPYYFEKGILFVHGHERLEGIEGHKNFAGYKTIVIGHIHPAISLRDEVGVMHKYRALLKGNYEGRELVVLPAISPLASGTTVSDGTFSADDFSPIFEACDAGEFVPIVADELAGVREFPRIKFL